MKSIKNSCGKRGCRTLILVHDRRPNNVRSRMLSVGNDIKKVLSITKPTLDSLEVKKVA